MTVGRTVRSRKTRGQALTEFALVVPVLFFILFGIIEASLLIFTVGTARFATGEAARQESESGNATTADQATIKVIRDTALGTTRIAQVTEIDIYRLIPQGNGTFAVDNSHYMRYQLDGTLLGTNSWPANTRNVTNGQSDFLGVTIKYTYRWKTGVMFGVTPQNLQQSVYIRLEPQTY